MNSNPKGAALLLAAVGVLMGVLFLTLGWRMWEDHRELWRTGKTVRATILEKHRGNGSENGLVCYRFLDAATGLAHEGQVNLSSRLWHQLSKGGSLTLTSVPGQPASAQPGPKWGWQLRALTGAGLMAFGIIATAVFFVAAVRSAVSGETSALLAPAP